MVLSPGVLRFLGVDPATRHHADLNQKADLECHKSYARRSGGGMSPKTRDRKREKRTNLATYGQGAIQEKQIGAGIGVGVRD